MALQLWLPLIGDLHNQGLLDEKKYLSSNLTYGNDGKIGNKSLQFKGDASQILSFSNVPQKKSNFTWMCWVKQTNRTSSVQNNTIQYVLSQGRDCGSIGFNMFINNGEIRILLGSGNIDNSSDTTIITKNGMSGGTLNLNTWCHICCSVDDKKVFLYINGELVNSCTLVDITYYNSSDSYFTIGKMSTVHTNTTKYFPFDGYIQDVKVYDECLSAKEIKLVSQSMICHYTLGNIDGKIGGRNLLKNTHKTAATFTYPTSSYKDWFSGVTTIPLNGDTYTLSFWAKSTVNGDKIRTHFYNPSNITSVKGSQGQSSFATDGLCNFTLSTTLTKYWVTYTIPKNGNSTRSVIVPRLVYGSGTGTITVQWEKLEEGNKNTPYTPAPEDNPQFYDNTISDISGYQNNATVTDSICPTWSDESPRYSGSYHFNGTQYISGSSPVSTLTKEFTIAFWAKLVNKINNMTFFSARTGIGNGISLFLIAGGKIRLDDNKQSTFNNSFDFVDEWVHLCVTRNTINKKLYINGKLVDTLSDIGDMQNVGKYFTIGASESTDNGIGSDNFINGNLSDFRIYSTALTDEDVLNLYQSSASLDSQGNLMLSGEVVE